MSQATATTFPTSVTKEVVTEVSTSFYVRPSKKNPDTIVVGLTEGDTSKRVALIRVNDDGTVKVRTLDGNPREASSKAESQTVITLSLDELTDDPTQG